MDFLLLTLIFGATGALALGYDRRIPDAASVRQRLPNRITWLSLLLSIGVAIAFWYVFTHFSGVRRAGYTFGLVLSLLLFESIFLYLLRIIKSNSIAILIALGAAAAFFFLGVLLDSGLLTNLMIVLASMGIASLLVRIRYMGEYPFLGLAVLWAAYDYWVITQVLSRAFVPGSAQAVLPFFPVVNVGGAALGSGDFFFLTIFSVFLLHRFSYRIALLHIALQTAVLFLTGLLLLPGGTSIPYLMVMLPILMIAYAAGRIRKNKTSRTEIRDVE